MSGGRSSKVWYQGEITKESLSQPQTHGGHRECNVREIPMLSMFLQRLHQHHYFPPIRVWEKNRLDFFLFFLLFRTTRMDQLKLIDKIVIFKLNYT